MAKSFIVDDVCLRCFGGHRVHDVSDDQCPDGLGYFVGRNQAYNRDSIELKRLHELDRSRSEPGYGNRFAQQRTDFSTWDRERLERFARQAADENKKFRDALVELQKLL